MNKYEVKKMFVNKESGEFYKTGEIVELEADRAKEINKAIKGALEEIKGTKTEEKAKAKAKAEEEAKAKAEEEAKAKAEEEAKAKAEEEAKAKADK